MWLCKISDFMHQWYTWVTLVKSIDWMAVWSQNAPSIRPLPSSHGLHTVVGGPGALTAIYSNTVLLEYHLYTSYICVKIGIFTLDIGYPDPKLHHQRGHRSSLTFLDIPGASVAASTNQQAAERNPYQLKSGEMEISAQPRYTARSIFSPEKKHWSNSRTVAVRTCTHKNWLNTGIAPGIQKTNCMVFQIHVSRRLCCEVGQKRLLLMHFQMKGKWRSTL